MTDAADETPAGDEVARAAALEHRIAELEAAMTRRLVQAELKMEAVRHGMVDLDGLKLADAATVSVDEHGEVQGAGAVMQALKRAKPWLFGGASSSSAAKPPPAEAPKPRHATEMDFNEWQAARAELLRRV